MWHAKVGGDRGVGGGDLYTRDCCKKSGLAKIKLRSGPKKSSHIFSLISVIPFIVYIFLKKYVIDETLRIPKWQNESIQLKN